MNVFSSAAPELDLNALFDHASIGIMVTDEDGYIIKANPFLLKMFGYELTELAGNKIEVLVPATHRGNHAAKRNKYMAHPEKRMMGNGVEFEAVKKSGELFCVDVSLSPHFQNGNKYVTAFINDITLRKKAESDLLEVKAKDLIMEVNLLREMQLNELKSKFVSMASHEFRLPLSAILSSSYLISQYGQKGNFEQQEKHVNKIQHAVSLLTGILNNFLSIEKIEGGKIEPSFSEVTVTDYLTNIIEEINPLTSPGQALIYEHTGDPTLQTDIVLLRHIMTNLLSNAVKFSPKNENVYLFSECTGTKVEIRVVDHGIGIPAEAQANIFDRFFRAANSASIQGTGLGLSIIASYVKLLKGSITFESEEGKGTTFILTFANKPAR
ncbi:PAS domain-containing sensor histidine kinase [Chitinophaga sancti]|uniref:histidine kinase n=1 Tax=Chitinophaga sancti TaxID=1004 RepID=A0A1K1SLX0_9BACT|nr:PAS domain-containing sensor histidine kinase [Chitinophaga sancti]WQD63887.1 PAS domain-containing sensor histidine kinase [Chitinophaga sancti]WQG90488.1 PAS domain-containing sensor histidine kinase [Chitinophaga sancti]SFW85294.1 PAS domain S-box-containing protein [Chitinophaga sancti]